MKKPTLEKAWVFLWDDAKKQVLWDKSGFFASAIENGGPSYRAGRNCSELVNQGLPTKRCTGLFR